jgi:hypothetical protein
LWEVSYDGSSRLSLDPSLRFGAKVTRERQIDKQPTKEGIIRVVRRPRPTPPFHPPHPRSPLSRCQPFRPRRGRRISAGRCSVRPSVRACESRVAGEGAQIGLETGTLVTHWSKTLMKRCAQIGLAVRPNLPGEVALCYEHCRPVNSKLVWARPPHADCTLFNPDEANRTHARARTHTHSLSLSLFLDARSRAGRGAAGRGTGEERRIERGEGVAVVMYACM